MPEISRFFGIIIAMFGDDHNPPHFHVRYGDNRCTITIDKGVVKGQLPRKALKKVFEWMDEHHDELMANWARLQAGEEALPIDPLKETIMENQELLRVVDVDYLHDYTMELEFSNGERRIVDFRPLLVGKLREQLLEHDKFVQFALTDWTLEWFNGVDFAPERLYELGKAA